MKRIRLLPLAAALLLGAAACDDPTGSRDPELFTPFEEPVALPVLGRGTVADRFTGELWVRGDVAYTTTWHNPASLGSALYVWNVSGIQPRMLDSVVVQNIQTFGDVQASDDGRILVVAAERNPEGSIFIYDLADPRKPRLITRYVTPNTRPGVHTAELARVGGKLYAFLSIDPVQGVPAKLVIVDLSDPASPREVWAQAMGRPFVHDVFVRDGYLFTANWDDGLVIWDIGAQGGSPASPRQISSVRTVGGNVHNVWWYQDARTGSKRYVLVGEEQASYGPVSAGDIHVVDVSDINAPKEVAFFHVPDATVNGERMTYGTHNFSVDEERGILYSAYYNGGVRALDLRGDLGTCTDAQRSDADHGTGVVMLCDLGRVGREVGRALSDQGSFIWGVHQAGSRLYASDMNSGLWTLSTAPLLSALGR